MYKGGRESCTCAGREASARELQCRRALYASNPVSPCYGPRVPLADRPACHLGLMLFVYGCSSSLLEEELRVRC